MAIQTFYVVLSCSSLVFLFWTTQSVNCLSDYNFKLHKLTLAYFIECPLTIGESEVGRALYKSKNNCRVAKFKNAKREQEEKKIDDKLLSTLPIKLKKEQNNISLSEITLNRTVYSHLNSELFLLLCSEIFSLLSETYFVTTFIAFFLLTQNITWLVKMNISYSVFDTKIRVVSCLIRII